MIEGHHGRRWRSAVLLGLVGVAALACLQLEEGPRGLDLQGHQVAPLDTQATATTLIFVRSDCPISNRYAPEMQRLHDEYDPAGMQFYLVFPDPDETPESIQRHTADHNLSVEVLRDPAHDLVDHVEATVTPSAAVFVGHQLVYSGRIDDRYIDLGRARPMPTRQNLRDVLDAVVNGEVPPLQRTRAVGCLIADLK